MDKRVLIDTVSSILRTIAASSTGEHTTANDGAQQEAIVSSSMAEAGDAQSEEMDLASEDSHENNNVSEFVHSLNDAMIALRRDTLPLSPVLMPPPMARE